MFLSSVILSMFCINSSRAFEKWERVRGRHKFFYFWNLFVVFAVVVLCSAGLFQSYQNDGVQIILVFVLCNYYVICLQLVWRFSVTEAPEIRQEMPGKDELRDYASEQQSVSRVEDPGESREDRKGDVSLEMQPYASMNEGRSVSADGLGN